MKLLVELDVPADPDDVMPWVDSLGAYPSWTGLVHRVTPESGADPAWLVELRTRIGPLARSKRLRMVRVETSEPGYVRFERAETDGRDHGRWELDARCVSTGSAGRPSSHLTVTLSYDGSNWAGGLVERALYDEVERSKERLTELVTSGRLPEPTP